MRVRIPKGSVLRRKGGGGGGGGPPGGVMAEQWRGPGLRHGRAAAGAPAASWQRSGRGGMCHGRAVAGAEDVSWQSKRVVGVFDTVFRLSLLCFFTYPSGIRPQRGRLLA
jgi:hypothetical protein